jgi:hypothetical protein
MKQLDCDSNNAMVLTERQTIMVQQESGEEWKQVNPN